MPHVSFLREVYIIMYGGSEGMTGIDRNRRRRVTKGGLKKKRKCFFIVTSKEKREKREKKMEGKRKKKSIEDIERETHAFRACATQRNEITQGAT